MTKNQKEQKRLAIVAVNWLKKKAVEAADKGRGWERRGYNTGDIVRGLGMEAGWNSREKVYQQLILGLKQAEELGYVSVGRNTSPIRFQYCGPEVDDAIKAYDAKEKATVANIKRLCRKLGVRDPSINHGRYEKEATVTLTERQFHRVCQKANI